MRQRRLFIRFRPVGVVRDLQEGAHVMTDAELMRRLGDVDLCYRVLTEIMATEAHVKTPQEKYYERNKLDLNKKRYERKLRARAAVGGAS